MRGTNPGRATDREIREGHDPGGSRCHRLRAAERSAARGNRCRHRHAAGAGVVTANVLQLRTGCAESAAPLAAVVDGCVAMTSFAGAPAPIAITEEATGVRLGAVSVIVAVPVGPTYGGSANVASPAASVATASVVVKPPGVVTPVAVTVTPAEATALSRASVMRAVTAGIAAPTVILAGGASDATQASLRFRSCRWPRRWSSARQRLR